VSAQVPVSPSGFDTRIGDAVGFVVAAKGWGTQNRFTFRVSRFVLAAGT
jgi:hypothetical protein